MNSDSYNSYSSNRSPMRNDVDEEQSGSTSNSRAQTPGRPSQIHRNTSYRRVLADHSSYSSTSRPHVGTPDTYNNSTTPQPPSAPYQSVGSLLRQPTKDTLGDGLPMNYDVYRQDLAYIDNRQFHSASPAFDKTRSLNSVTTSTNKRSNASLNSLGKQGGAASIASYKITPVKPASLNYSKRAKKYCCCFKSRCGCCTFWLVFLFIFLGALAVAGYFVYPRMPNIKISGEGNRVNSLRYVGTTFTASTDSPFIIRFGLNFTVNVESQNYLDWDLSYVKVEGNLLNLDGSKNLYINGSGQVDNITIKKFANTTFVLPVNVTYYLTVPTADINQEPNIQSLLGACGVKNGTNSSDLQLSYKVSVGVKLIEWTSYVPTFDGTASFACPIPKGAWEEVIGQFSPKNLFLAAMFNSTGVPLYFQGLNSWSHVGIALLTVAGVAVVFSVLTDLLSPSLGPPEYKGGWPIIGNILQLMPYSVTFKSHIFFTSVLKETGPIALVRILFRKIVIVGDAAAAKQVLTNGDHFCKRGTMIQKRFLDVSKNALFVLPSGDIWKKHRKLLQPAFGPLHLKHVFDATLDRINTLFTSIWNHHIEKDEAFNIHLHMSCLTADVIGQVAFSYDMSLVKNLLNQDKLKQVHHLETILVYVVRQFLPPFIRYMYGIEPVSIMAPMKDLQNLFQDVIDNKRKSSGQHDNKNLDVLDRLLQGMDDMNQNNTDSTFSEQELMDEMFAFFLAGHETTANTIVFAALELCQHPHVFEKLRQESDQVWKSCNGKLTYESISQLKYAEAVIKEALRLYPVVSGIIRTTANDVLLCGRVVKKDTDISVSVRYLHRNELYWQDPLVFKPERWLEEGFSPVPGSYLPFGDGPMNCKYLLTMLILGIGQKMAMIEAKLVVSHIAHLYNLELIPGQDLEPLTTITTGLKNGLLLKAKKRI